MQKGSNPNITENAQKLLVENRGVLKTKYSCTLRNFCGNVGYGGRTRSEQASCSVFQFIADSLDDYHRHDHDCHGTRKYIRRKERG